jgi:hypothetical protein
VPEEAGSHRRVRWKLALPLIAVLVLAAVGSVGFGLVHSRCSGPADASGSSVCLGADGIPTQIDGQPVYLVDDQPEWQSLTSSFLLAAYPDIYMGSGLGWSMKMGPNTNTAEDDLLGSTASLGSLTGSRTDTLLVAAKSPALDSFFAWSGWAVVVRVHTHDPEVAQCGADKRARCDAAIVVEAFVWPTVPSEINGEPVRRATELDSLRAAGALTNGSFLLGGVVRVQAAGVMAGPCASYGSFAEQQLLETCHPQVWIDGELIAPDSNIDQPNGEVVVARAHIDDPLAAQCPAAERAQCQAAIVVESVVWASNPYSPATPTLAVPSPTGSAT